MDTIKTFFSKIRLLFPIFKKGRGRPPPSPEYPSMSVYMPKYPWKSLNKLFWLWQGSEYAWPSYMLDRLLKISWVLKKSGFWIFSLNLYQLLQGCLLFLGLGIFFMVTRLWYRTKNIYWFWNQISLWNVSSASRSLIVARGRHGHFWVASLW